MIGGFMSSGDGWTICAAGHRHWGLFGAAGLLLVDDHRVVLQHRAPWTHEGDSWGLPGGARNQDETPLDAAVREATEEAALTADGLDPIGLYVDDHGGWNYTTVVARATRTLHPVAANAESVAVLWHPISEVTALPLHAGFAAAWQHLQAVPQPLYLVLYPDIVEDPRVAELARDGIAAQRLPAGMDSGGLSRLLPHLILANNSAEVAEAIALHANVGQVIVAADRSDLALLCPPGRREGI